MLDKEQIEAEKTYDDCSVILKEFDKNNCQFSKDVDALLNVYADAAKNVIILNNHIRNGSRVRMFLFTYTMFWKIQIPNINVSIDHSFILNIYR